MDIMHSRSTSFRGIFNIFLRINNILICDDLYTMQNHMQIKLLFNWIKGIEGYYSISLNQI